MENSKEYENAKKVEELTESSFFDYQVSRKIKDYLSGRYNLIRNVLAVVLTLIVAVLGYFGFDAYETAEMIQRKDREIDSLSRRIDNLNTSLQGIMDELTGEVNSKIEDMDKIKENMEKNATKVSESSKLLHGNVNIMGSSVQSINDQWIFLKERAEQVAGVQREIEIKLKDADNILTKAQEKLDQLDEEDLLKRIGLLEKTNDHLFSAYDDKKAKSVNFRDKRYVISASEIGDTWCKLKVGNSDYLLELGEDPTTIDNEIKLELLLISSFKESILSRRSKSVTLRIYNEPKAS